jgi:hypothetical protein
LSLFLMTCETSSIGMLVNKLTTSRMKKSINEWNNYMLVWTVRRARDTFHKGRHKLRHDITVLYSVHRWMGEQKKQQSQ